ncbi:uncharacterized protein LOC123556116 [Mercenaria mercenaria]|uniref:uncharacterized protein LOC123556116 n=1 Tax=Mercenaria mercenaria TaxID=6596 RepID=UPI00234E3FC5|nr:uncharacterized protein LOC123556116 [Mercenaria mercenaria]
MDANKEISDACDRNESLHKFNIPVLKFYLRSRGQHVSGNKSELIERVKGTHRLGLRDLNSVMQEDNDLAAKRLTEKLKTPLGKTLKHPDYIDTWSSDYTNIPDITEKDVYNYFVFKIQTKRQLKAKVMFEDRHVHSIEVNESSENDSHCFVRCRVIQSMPTSNKSKPCDYATWVMLSKVTGCVHSADCGCQAGESEGCNHIAAFLYALVDITEKKKNGTLAPTSVKCKWNNPRKRKLTPKKSQDLDFQKVVHGKTVAKKLLNVYNVDTSVNIDRLKQKLLNGNSQAGWLKNFQLQTSNVLLPKLHSINFNFHDSVDINSEYCENIFREYFESLSMTEDDCVKIEYMTRNQNDSHFWMEARHERLTAFNFGQIIRMKETTKPDSLLNSLMGYKTFTSSHGLKHEPAARRSYRRYMQHEHPGLSVKKSGLLTNTKYPYLGASPDGLIDCTHCQDPNGLLELKCPSSLKWRMKTPAECSEDPTFFCAHVEGRVALKRKHSYDFQVQGQPGLSGRKWCDFVVWTCMGLSIERIVFDADVFVSMVKKFEQFYIKAFIPELFTQRIRRGVRDDITAEK